MSLVRVEITIGSCWNEFPNWIPRSTQIAWRAGGTNAFFLGRCDAVGMLSEP
jgi:hypothetical protein